MALLHGRRLDLDQPLGIGQAGDAEQGAGAGPARLRRAPRGRAFDLGRVMKPFREAVEAAERAQLQAEEESRAALDVLKTTELTLFGNPRRRAALPGIDFDAQYIYVGEVEEFVSTTARAEGAQLFTTPALDVALIVPKARATQGRGRGRFDRRAREAYREFHGQPPSGRDFMLDLPLRAGRDAGEAVLLIYTADKGGKSEYLYHFHNVAVRNAKPMNGLPRGSARPLRATTPSTTPGRWGRSQGAWGGRRFAFHLSGADTKSATGGVAAYRRTVTRLNKRLGDLQCPRGLYCFAASTLAARISCQ